jgi:hypothetical protein
MNERSLLWLWVFMSLCLLLVLFCTYEVYILATAVLEINDRLEQYEPILQQLKQIQDEVRAESRLDASLSLEVSAHILFYQALYHESPLSFKLACIKQESSFNPYAVGPCSEQGLTQIYYPTWQACKAKGDYYNWRDTLRLGYAMMDDYWRMSQGDARLAAMMYNGGPRILHRSESAIAMAMRHGKRVATFYSKYKEVIL